MIKRALVGDWSGAWWGRAGNEGLEGRGRGQGVGGCKGVHVSTHLVNEILEEVRGGGDSGLSPYFHLGLWSV